MSAHNSPSGMLDRLLDSRFAHFCAWFFEEDSWGRIGLFLGLNLAISISVTLSVTKMVGVW